MFTQVARAPSLHSRTVFKSRPMYKQGKKMTAIKFILALFIFMSISVFADKPAPPSSYKIISSNNNFVFVMIAPLTLEQELRPWNEAKKKEILEVRNLYSQSGMYKNDSTNELLWPVDWFAYGVEIANDGAHIVRHGPWASSMEDDAIIFYANGKVVGSYKIDRLVKNKRKLEHTASHFFWEKESLFDREQLRYYIETLDNKHYIFDIKSGNIISGQK